MHDVDALACCSCVCYVGLFRSLSILLGWVKGEGVGMGMMTCMFVVVFCSLTHFSRAAAVLKSDILFRLAGCRCLM